MDFPQKPAGYPALLLAVLLGLSQCKKDDPDPVDQLPPATQTGANTFGCLVNGQAWTPQGSDGGSNYSVYYDRAYRNGTFNISTYRYAGNELSKQIIAIYSDSLRTTGNYPLAKDGRQEALFKDRRTGCEFFGGTYYRRGSLTITRLDLQAGIISGTFEFTLAKPGCDTVRVTNGRFDKRL
ncbi:DUF6252 family protein [Hymenobacter glacialis]|uniref:DUF6252 family protein n=1 Tax=Hymenobacter glacialis TaxID=1908236 RepID=UPI000A4CD454|nr:DUF6252 family protein [Hymenobacter glacialis]